MPSVGHFLVCLSDPFGYPTSPDSAVAFSVSCLSQCLSLFHNDPFSCNNSQDIADVFSVSCLSVSVMFLCHVCLRGCLSVCLCLTVIPSTDTTAPTVLMPLAHRVCLSKCSSSPPVSLSVPVTMSVCVSHSVCLTVIPSAAITAQTALMPLLCHVCQSLFLCLCFSLCLFVCVCVCASLSVPVSHSLSLLLGVLLAFSLSHLSFFALCLPPSLPPPSPSLSLCVSSPSSPLPLLSSLCPVADALSAS